jgi:hypothetical protein
MIFQRTAQQELSSNRILHAYLLGDSWCGWVPSQVPRLPAPPLFRKRVSACWAGSISSRMLRASGSTAGKRPLNEARRMCCRSFSFADLVTGRITCRNRKEANYAPLNQIPALLHTGLVNFNLGGGDKKELRTPTRRRPSGSPGEASQQERNELPAFLISTGPEPSSIGWAADVPQSVGGFWSGRLFCRLSVNSKTKNQGKL